jgi:hypothetical protein
VADGAAQKAISGMFDFHRGDPVKTNENDFRDRGLSPDPEIGNI